MDGLDRAGALGGLVLSAALAAFTLLRGASPLYLLIAVLLAFSCTYWLVLRPRLRRLELADDGYGARRMVLIGAAAFFVLLALSILVLYFRPSLYERPLSYFVISALMAGEVALQAVYSRGRWSALVLLQIVVLGLSLAWSQQFIYPGPLDSDPWYHRLMIEYTLQEGHIPPFFLYSFLPLFHLLVGQTSLLLQVDLKAATMLAVSLGEVIVVALFIYLIGTKVTGNHKIGLLAALFLAISDHQILMATTIIPGTLAAVLVPVLLYVLLRARRDRGIAIGLSALLMFAVVLTHTITSVWVAMLLLGGALAVLMLGLRRRVDKLTTWGLTTFFLVIMFGWWAYASNTIRTLSELIRWGFDQDIIEPTRILIDVPVTEQLVIAAGMYVLFSFSIIGLLYLVTRKQQRHGFELAVILTVPLAIGLLSMLTGLFINYQRWFFFAQIAMAIPVAISAYLLFGLHRNRAGRNVAMSAFVILITFLMIMGGIASPDNHLLSPTSGVSRGPTLSHLAAVETTTMMWPHPATDTYYTNLFLTASGYNFTPLDENFLQRDFSGLDDYIVLIRRAVEDGPFFLKGGVLQLDYKVEPELYALGYSRVYDNGLVRGYAT